MPLSRHSDLANMNVYADIYGFRRTKVGGGGERWGRAGGAGGRVYLSTLPSPDASSICKYLQTVMSGIYTKVTEAEPASYQSGNK